MRRRGEDLSLGLLVAMVAISFLTMLLAILLCKLIAPGSLIPFAISEVAAFLGCVVVYVAIEAIGHRS